MATESTDVYTGNTPQRYVMNAYNKYSSKGVAVTGLRGGAGSFGMHSANAGKGAPGGQDLNVLLGVSTWEHTWLRDYGPGGKRSFLEAWWDRIDWGVVEGILGNVARPEGKYGLGG